MVSVFIVSPNQAIGNVHRMFYQHKKFDVTTSLADADLIQFIGGEDVHPRLYGEKLHDMTVSNIKRDMKEIKFFQIALKRKIPMVGICRGGQFLNVMSGGSLYQDVTSHRGNHPLFDTITGEQIEVTSTHHQMMIPGTNGELVAFAEQGGLKRRMHDSLGEMEIDDEKKDPEVVFYEKTKSLCFQPHPEFYNNKTREYFFSLLARYFNME